MRSVTWSAWLAPGVAALVGVLPVAVVAWQQTPPALGSVLPRIQGESLSGKRIVLPEHVKGRVGLLVFSFSREAGEATRCWNDAYGKIGLAEADAATFGVMMLGDVPWLIRGLVMAGIKSGVPRAWHDRTVKVLENDDPWRARLGVRSAEAPHLVLIDWTGKIRWLSSAPCDGAGEQRLSEQLKALVSEKPPR